MSPKSEKENNKRLGAVFSVSLISGVALVLGVQALIRPVLSSPKFIVQQVEAVWPNENRRSVERYRLVKPMSIFDVDLEGIGRALQQQYPSAEVESVHRVLPNRVVATLKYKRAIVQVKTDRYYPISEEGIVMLQGQLGPWPDLPILYVDGFRAPLPVGALFEHPSLEWSSELLAAVRRQGGVAGHHPGSIRCKGEEITLYLDSGLEIRFVHSRFWPAWQQLIDLVAQRPEILQGAKYVDLRFEDPVIGNANTAAKGKGKRN